MSLELGAPVGWNSVESVDGQHASQNGEIARLVEEGREVEYAGYDELMRVEACARRPFAIVHGKHGGPR